MWLNAGMTKVVEVEQSLMASLFSIVLLPSADMDDDFMDGARGLKLSSTSRKSANHSMISTSIVG